MVNNAEGHGLRDGYGGKVRFQRSLAASSERYHRVLREATKKSKDARIDQVDFMNHASASTRYGMFSPMEVSIIFHFAGRGSGNQRLALVDFAQLLDPGWQAPRELEKPAAKQTHFLLTVAESAYNFVSRRHRWCFRRDYRISN